MENQKSKLPLFMGILLAIVVGLVCMSLGWGSLGRQKLRQTLFLSDLCAVCTSDGKQPTFRFPVNSPGTDRYETFHPEPLISTQTLGGGKLAAFEHRGRALICYWQFSPSDAPWLTVEPEGLLDWDIEDSRLGTSTFWFVILECVPENCTVTVEDAEGNQETMTLLFDSAGKGVGE